MIRRSIVTFGVVAAVGFAGMGLAGCTGQAGTPQESETSTMTTTPSETTTPEPTEEEIPEGQTYLSLAELRDAVAHAGYPCDSWTQENQIPAASESGWCGSPASLGLSLYADQASRDEVLSNSAGSMEPGLFLIGPNWLITVSEGTDPNELAILQTSLGGELSPLA